jgi:hypothetical protein
MGTAIPSPSNVPRRSIVRRLARGIVIGVRAVLLTGTLGWATLAVYFADTHAGPRRVTAALWVLATAAAMGLIRPHRLRFGALAALFVAVVLWFFSLAPSNDRDWSAECAHVPSAVLDGNRLMVRNVRNFAYRTETDFTPRWEGRQYDLAAVDSADLFLVYWGSPHIAHVMISFGFRDGRHLCVSIEARKERTESYSAVEGFFRQFELLYVVADERDLVRLRTTYRAGEDVYLYRTDLSPAQARAALESYLGAANSLAAAPQFYNALTSNCATNVLEHARRGGAAARLTTDVLLSGHADRQAYREGRLDRSIPFDELKRRSLINPAARAAGDDVNFSARIRAGLPDPRPGR